MSQDLFLSIIFHAETLYKVSQVPEAFHPDLAALFLEAGSTKTTHHLVKISHPCVPSHNWPPHPLNHQALTVS